MNQLAVHEEFWRNRRKNFPNLIATEFGIAELRRGCIVFGAAVLGKKVISGLQSLGIAIKAVLDNDPSKHGASYMGVNISKPADFVNTDLPVVIASKFVCDIDQQLQALNVRTRIPHYVLSILHPEVFPNELHRNAIALIEAEWPRVQEAYGLLSDELSRKTFFQLIHFRHTLQPADLPHLVADQYFIDMFWQPCDWETYVDVGAYCGDTLQEYLTRCKGTFRKYLAIEPDKVNYRQLLSIIPTEYAHKIDTWNLAAGVREGKHAFHAVGGLDSRFVAVDSIADAEIINTVALDDLLRDEDACTIKMDVEGWESQVLEGAIEIIRERQPRLAVCVYHRPDHLWSLLLQITQINRNYRFFLRHHESEIYGTVLYCISEGASK